MSSACKDLLKFNFAGAHLDLPSPEANRNISVISRPADSISNQRILLIPTMESRQLSV